jgi:predicted nucleic acid-binding protein
VDHFVDTNIAVRDADSSDPLHATTRQACTILHRRGDILRIAPQVLIEFRCVATRPVAVNGLGLSASDAEAEIARLKRLFPLLPETPDIFPAWESLVISTGTVGKAVHDARIVAICHVHGITHLLTYNTQHFKRFENIGPGITLVDPRTVK